MKGGTEEANSAGRIHARGSQLARCVTMVGLCVLCVCVCVW